MDNFSLSNSTSMKGKSMNAMKGGATTSTPMSTAKSSKAEADLLDDLFGSTPKKGPSGGDDGWLRLDPGGGRGGGFHGRGPTRRYIRTRNSAQANQHVSPPQPFRAIDTLAQPPRPSRRYRFVLFTIRS